MGPLLKYSDKLWEVLDDIRDSVSLRLIEMEMDPILHNGLNIKYVDVSKQEWSFDVTIGDKIETMKVGKLIRYFLPGVFSQNQIHDFTVSYNRVKSGGKPISREADVIGNAKKVDVVEFKFNPKDVRSTFISLVTETYPHGHEEEVVKYLTPGLNKDQFGNYYKVIGKSQTMFTCHIDTVDRVKSDVSLLTEMRDGQEYIFTDRRTILGADDKSGVAILMYMISHNIPGVYYFFIGEERGGIGSHKVSDVFDSVTHLNGMKRCVSFDRRNYYSVITEQFSGQCCSNDFATALCNEMNKSGLKLGLDPTGVYTDSASFIEQIPECTNVSVGYMHEHQTIEYQNMTYLIKLAEACVKVNWESLPTVRKVGFDEDITILYRSFITDFKAVFSEATFITEYGRSYIKFPIYDEINTVHDDLLNLSFLFHKHKMDPDIYFDDDLIKIELR